MPTRKQVQEVARQYADTPFGHQGRVKGRALDCVGLVLCVSEDLGIVDREGNALCRDTYNTYGPQPASTFVLDSCRKHLIEKDWANVKPGDVLCLRIPTDPTHTAIVTERAGVLYMLHAYDGGLKRCVEHIIDTAWRRRVVSVFEFPGIED